MSNVIEQYKRITVQTRRDWLDEWEDSELRCTAANIGIAPISSTAKFEYHYGTVTYPASLISKVVSPLEDDEILNFFVKVLADGLPLFIGQIINVQKTFGKVEEIPTGMQLLTAIGLENCLSQTAIEGSYIWDYDSVTMVDRQLSFNYSSADGLKLLGNRSKEKHTFGDSDAECYVFSSEGELWTARDILDYFLVMWNEEFGPEFSLRINDELGNLDEYISIWKMPTTLLESIDMLFDRRRAHAWQLDFSGDDPEIVAVSLLGDDIKKPVLLLGNTTKTDIYTTQSALDAAQQSDMNISMAVIPASCPPVVTSSSLNQYDKIIVRGEPILQMGTFGYGDTWQNSLKQVWSAKDETDYAAASEAYRATEKFFHVFTSFQVNVTKSNALFFTTNKKRRGAVVLDKDGSVKFDLDGSFFFTGKKFERQLPIKDAYGCYKHPLVWIKDNDAGTQDTIYAQIDRLGETFQSCASVHLKLMDDRLGFTLRATPQHLFARGYFNGTAELQPVFDWHNIFCTMAVRLDTYLQVVEEIASDTTGRTLVINVPKAECWVARKGTVIGIKDNKPEYLEVDTIYRNDADRLRVVAALAANWYSRPRSAVTIQSNVCDTQIRLGEFIRNICTEDELIKCNTVVTSIAWTFGQEEQTTTITTDFVDLDFAAITGADVPRSTQPETPPDLPIVIGSPTPKQIEAIGTEAYQSLLTVPTGSKLAKVWGNPRMKQ